MDLRLRTRPAPGALEVAVIEVAGELDLHSAPTLRAEAVRIVEEAQTPRIIVDLSGVTFLDSTGVGVLVGALKRAREAGGDVYFCSCSARVQRVFEITGLVGALPLFSTREAALEAFRAPQFAESAESTESHDE